MSYIIFLKEHSTKTYFQAESYMHDAYLTLRLPRNPSTLWFNFSLGLNLIFLCCGIC